MNSVRTDHPDAARAILRSAIADIEVELARLTPQGAGPELRRRFDVLVSALALGPEPEVRECPTCGHLVMRDANICSACWTKLRRPGP